jgi:hypothetical protein
MYCGQCGQSNPESNKFCGKCGRPLTFSAPFSQASQESDSYNACPVCKRTDQIRKLSSISSAETRKTLGKSYSSGRANIYDKDSNFIGDSHSSSSSYIDTTEQSELAKKIECPPIPPRPSEPSKDNPLLETIIIGIFSLLGLCVSVYTGMEFYEYSKSFLHLFLGCIVGLILTVLVGGLAIGIPLALLTQPSQEQKQAYQEQIILYEKHLAKWKQASQKWEQMFYCYRDDVVFLPGESGTVQPDKTVQFCYQNIKE